MSGIFLDISKIFKLKPCGIDGDLMKLLINYLEDCRQRVLLNGKACFWEKILVVFPQGSVLGPIWFLIYINDLAVGIKSTCKTIIEF